jgi:hypothetical protein
VVILTVPSCVSHSKSSLFGADQQLSKPRKSPRSDPGGGFRGTTQVHTQENSRLTTGCSQAAFELLSVHVPISANASSFFHNFRQDNIAANIIENWVAWFVLKHKQIYAYTHETHIYMYLHTREYIYTYKYIYTYLFKSIYLSIYLQMCLFKC